MDRVLDGFTACLNFKLSDRAPPDKIALAEGGTDARTVKLRITNVGDLNFKPIVGVQLPGRVKTNAVVPPPCQSNESQIARSLPRQVLFCRAGRGR